MSIYGRLLWAVVLALSCIASAVGAPTDWRRLSAGALSLDAPPGATLKAVAPQTWELHGRGLTVGLVRGPRVADADDAEPRRCYSTEIVLFAGAAGVLRATRPAARADCPEGYASLYRPPLRPGAPALFLWAWDEGGDGYAAARAVIRSIRLDSEP